MTIQIVYLELAVLLQLTFAYLYIHCSLISLAFHWKEFLVPQLWYKERFISWWDLHWPQDVLLRRRWKFVCYKRRPGRTILFLKCQHTEDSCHKQAKYLLLFLPQELLPPPLPICLCTWEDVEDLGLLKEVTTHPKNENACLESWDTVMHLHTTGKENKGQKCRKYIKRKGTIETENSDT